MPDLIKFALFSLVGFIITHTAYQRLSNEKVFSITKDSKGNIYELLFLKKKDLNAFPDTLIPENENRILSPYYIHKKDSAEQSLWLVTIGGNPYERPERLYSDEEGQLYLLGYIGNQEAFNSNSSGVSSTFNQTAYLVKYDTTGKEMWATFIPNLDVYRYYDLTFINQQPTIEGFFNGMMMKRTIWPAQNIYWRN